MLNRQRGRRVDAQALRRFMDRLLRQFPPGAGDGIALCLVSDRVMRRYNREFRGVDVPTDVLSFSATDDATPAASGYLGDVLISVDSAARQARMAGHPLQRELRLLALHGYLHLLGYDHERDDGQMLRLQRRLARTLLTTRSVSS